MRSARSLRVPIMGLLLLLAPLMAHSQETYSWGHPLPQSNALHNITFWDSERGWAVCGDATVLGTTDGGETWQLLLGPTPGAPEMNDIHALSATDLVAVGEGIFFSQDGGQTWISQPNPAGGQLWDLTTIPGGGLSACGESGAVLVSEDSGLSWSDRGVGSGTGHHHLWRSTDEGYVVGEDISHRTTDGGQTWTQITDFSSFQFNEIYFRDDKHGFIVEDFAVWESEDGGETWTEHFDGSQPSYRHRTVVISPDHLLSVANLEGAELWESLDGGQSWTNIQYHDTNGFPCLVRMETGRLLWGSDAGDIFLSDDNGHTYTNTTHRVTLSAAPQVTDFIARPDGVLFAADQPSGGSAPNSWLRSDDGGHSWYLPETNPGLRWIDDGAFVDNDHGLLCYREFIRTTDDGGATWQEQSLESGRRIWTVATPALDSYFLATSLNTGGDLLRSRDGGQTWTVVTPGTSWRPWA